METKSIILSGETLTITEDGPEKRPRPSLELPEMQKHLIRIAVMRGAFMRTDKYRFPTISIFILADSHV
ncbi:hypothetical protein N7481_007572 [Penicillium waksmanii]|uniref:uncharacterized protein n=1 Tax=Penicillium waksmanii TaxID=69791 RepID=UPI0025495DA7|nr:uncharacterized protein N7481_007572 [Penicillium waksmanii]KAJ5980274.1 hypothetical protein N7481_007572 [Penicillium waksmanii]